MAKSGIVVIDDDDAGGASADAKGKPPLFLFYAIIPSTVW
jgi:hypothetical protein